MTQGLARIVCFGEVLARLSTGGGEELAFAAGLDVHVGGAEANVGAALAWLGHDVRMVTALPEGPMGDRALVHLRGRGVDCRAVRRAEGRLGLYFVSTGGAVRPSEIFYDRADSVFVATDWSTLDWPALLDGADLLHVSGISLALGEASADAALAAMRSARACGVRVSFDGNFRPRLWQGQTRDPAVVIGQALALADIFFGERRDAALVLRRDVGNTPRAGALALLEAFPDLQLVAGTERTVESFDRHRIAARLDRRNDHHVTPQQAVEGIVDRIGGGDAFAAGVIDALLRDATIADMADTGLALTCLKHGQPGDAAAVSRAQLAAFGVGGFDVRR